MTTDFRQLGADGPAVFPLALGCAAMSGTYGQKRDDAESLATIDEALEHGVTMIDTADFYGSGHNEMLIGRAIKGRRDKVILSAKFGGLRSPDGELCGLDTRPVAIKNFIAYTLQRLGVDHIDIYRPARLDPAVPIEDTIGAISDLVQAGYVRHIGLSEVGPDTIRRAHAVHPITDLQIEYSLMSRTPEQHIFPLLEELGLSVTAYGVLSHGLLGGARPQAQAGDRRAVLPRFSGENFRRNSELVAALTALAQEKGATNAQMAIAWVMAQGDRIIPVIGPRNRTQLRDALAAARITLSAEDLAAIEQAVPADEVAGTRVNARQMEMLDSEQPPSGR